MLWKCCSQYASKSATPSSDHRTGKDQFSFQSQRKAMPKNVQTTAQLHSSHTLAKSCSKFSKPGFNSTWTVNFQMFKLDLEKAEEPEIILPTSVGSSKKQDNYKNNIYFCFIDYAKALDCVGHKSTVENSLRDGNTRPPYLPPEKPVCGSRRNRTGHGTMDWFQIGKGVHQDVYYHPAHLTYMQSTSCEMPG